MNYIVPIITALIPASVTLITSSRQFKLSKMHAAKQSILQMQMEDVIAVELLKKLPVNHSNIHYEYDEYKKAGGNSDIDKKMEEYEEWFNNVTKTVYKNK